MNTEFPLVVIGGVVHHGVLVTLVPEETGLFGSCNLCCVNHGGYISSLFYTWDIYTQREISITQANHIKFLFTFL